VSKEATIYEACREVLDNYHDIDTLFRQLDNLLSYKLHPQYFEANEFLKSLYIFGGKNLTNLIMNIIRRPKLLDELRDSDLDKGFVSKLSLMSAKYNDVFYQVFYERHHPNSLSTFNSKVLTDSDDDDVMLEISISTYKDTLVIQEDVESVLELSSKLLKNALKVGTGTDYEEEIINEMKELILNRTEEKA